MNWFLSGRFDPAALPLANRHYNRQKKWSNQFVPPGRCIVLLSERADALWVSSWQQFPKHAWPGAWNCSCFRNESSTLSSLLIGEAVAATQWLWEAPPQGIITFVDPTKTRPKRDPGRCFLRAGWARIGQTAKGLIVLGQARELMPAPERPMARQIELIPAD